MYSVPFEKVDPREREVEILGWNKKKAVVPAITSLIFFCFMAVETQRKRGL